MILLFLDKAASTKSLDQISYSASDTSTRRKILNRGTQVEDFRLDYSWVNGSTSNPFNVRSVFIKGHYIKAN